MRSYPQKLGSKSGLRVRWYGRLGYCAESTACRFSLLRRGLKLEPSLIAGKCNFPETNDIVGSSTLKRGCIFHKESFELWWFSFITRDTLVGGDV